MDALANRLEDAEALLRTAARLGRCGAWCVDLVAAKITWTDPVRGLQQAAAQGHVCSERIIARYVPEHRDLLRAAYLRCVAEGTAFDLELQALTSRQARVWVRVVGEALRHPDGRVVKVQGAWHDIQQVKEAEHERQQAHARQLRLDAELESRVRERTAHWQGANEELAAFTLAVAHDLRAPLAGIAGFSRAVAERLSGWPDDKARHFLARIRAGVARMEALLDALLELARVGRAEMQPRRVNVSALAQCTVEMLRAQEPGREVQVQVQAGLAAWGDARLLRTLVENLMGNAWKFSAGEQPAVIEVGQRADGAFYVRDNGVGFSMDQAEELFTPFRRLHAEGEGGGSGIGLASARRVVERHGGRIWAESSPHQGTVFCFTLAEGPAWAVSGAGSAPE